MINGIRQDCRYLLHDPKPPEGTLIPPCPSQFKLRRLPESQYNMVYSAGIFDYLPEGSLSLPISTRRIAFCCEQSVPSIDSSSLQNCTDRNIYCSPNTHHHQSLLLGECQKLMYLAAQMKTIQLLYN